MPRRLRLFLAAALLASAASLLLSFWHAEAAATYRRAVRDQAAHALHPSALGASRSAADRRRPGPAITPYVRPGLAAQMRTLRPAILAAAARHNRPAISGMSDHDFAVLIALILFNEHFGWFEERVTPVQLFTPLYEDLQRETNATGLSNLSLWPANIRPSVALEILRGQLPLPHSDIMLHVPVRVAGSALAPDTFDSDTALFAAISDEISQPELAVEYLAANLERGLYRAQYEGVSVTWRSLAAWHNQGIVAPAELRENPTASDYVRRASAYFGTARALIDGPLVDGPAPRGQLR